jgi:hypothetical protein
MFTNILGEFADKEVEITTTSGKSFTGSFKHQTSRNAVVIYPTKEYAAKRYGPVFIKESEIVSIREVLPFIGDEDDGDCCEKG